MIEGLTPAVPPSEEGDAAPTSEEGLPRTSNLEPRTTSGASIYTLSGPLKLQELGLGNLEIFGGKIVMDTEGNVKVEEITAEKYNVGKSAGQAIIPKGETSITIETSALTEKSLIFVTPERPVALGSQIIDEAHFKISISKPEEEDLKVNWWVVN